MTLEYKSLLHELNTNTQIVINVGKEIDKVSPTSIVLPNIANVRIQGISTNETISLHNCQLSHVNDQSSKIHCELTTDFKCKLEHNDKLHHSTWRYMNIIKKRKRKNNILCRENSNVH